VFGRLRVQSESMMEAVVIVLAMIFDSGGKSARSLLESSTIRRTAFLWQYWCVLPGILLFRRPDSVVPLSHRARKLLKSRAGCVRIGAGADCNNARPAGYFRETLRSDDSLIEIAFAPV